MKWHDRVLATNQFARVFGIRDDLSALGKFERIAEAFRKLFNINSLGASSANEVLNIQREAMWVDEWRPYYNLYPSVAEAFTKIDLDRVMCEDIRLPLPNLLIRLAVGGEVAGIRNLLISATTATDRRPTMMIVTDTGQTFEQHGLDFMSSITTVIGLERGVSIADKIAEATRLSHEEFKESKLVLAEPLNEQDEVISNTACRLVVAVCLLGDNSDLIEPSPLEADREKWERTHDPKYIEKAARRGKRGWDVGRHVEAAPGFRHPHFAIRWMGHGLPKRPVLRPIKGCLVNKQKILEVPTDWMDQPRKEPA